MRRKAHIRSTVTCALSPFEPGAPGRLSHVNRRTKIIASIGPASSDDSTLKAMVEAGMDVARLNLSHGGIDDAVERLHQICLLYTSPSPRDS